MFTISMDSEAIHITFVGMGKLLAMHKGLSVSLRSVEGGGPLPKESARIPRSRKSWKGSNVQGRFTMGSLNKQGERSFWAIRSGDQAVALTLKDFDYDKLIIEPENRDAFLDELRKRLGR
jgi:hypothetical protein